MRSSNKSMDSINLPDEDKIKNLQGGYVDSRRVYKEKGIDDFTNTVRANFDTAAPVSVPERTEEKKEIDEFDELIEERKKQADKKPKEKGIKFGGKYHARWLVRRIAIIAVIALFVVVTFLPPLSLSGTVGKVLDTNVFEQSNMAQLKVDLLSDSNVYDIENLSSEKPENYRVCTVEIDVRNFSPYSVEIPGFSIVSADPLYRDKFVSVKLQDGKADLSPFKVTTLTVEILVNISELDEKKLTEAMRSLVLRTNGMKKHIGPVPIPCVPAFIFVSDMIDYRLDSTTGTSET